MRISDWSSDVCSSDLSPTPFMPSAANGGVSRHTRPSDITSSAPLTAAPRYDRCAITRGERGERSITRTRVASSADVQSSHLNPISSPTHRSEEHTSELQSLMRISYAVFGLKKKKNE